MTLTTDLDSPGDVLIFYESSFVKKRPDSMGWKNQDQNAFRQSRQQAIDRGRTGPEHQHIFFGIIGRYPKAQKYRSVMGLSVTGLSCLLKGLPRKPSGCCSGVAWRRSAIQLFHQQCGIGYKAENTCVAQRPALGNRTVF